MMKEFERKQKKDNESDRKKSMQLLVIWQQNSFRLFVATTGIITDIQCVFVSVCNSIFEFMYCKL